MKTKFNRTFLLVMFLAVQLFAHAQITEVKINQLKANTYSVTVMPDLLKRSKLEWSNTPDTWTSAQPLKLRSTVETVELLSAHPIIKLENGRVRPVYASPRALMLEGAVNFRDLGGYVGKDGKQVKWGKVYRSADVSKLTDGDLKILLGLNIKMFCDLRGPVEIEAAPDRLPEGTSWINLPAGSEQAGSANSYMKYMKNPASADSMMMAFYTKNDHYRDKYKPMFDQLLALENDKALMFHCSAGKDRTGVGAALILYALGVNESDIVKDYEATNEYRKGANEAFIKKFTDHGISEKAAIAMMTANPKYLKASFDSLNKKYGSVDTFLELEMGLTTDKKILLQSKLLY